MELEAIRERDRNLLSREPYSPLRQTVQTTFVLREDPG